MSHHLWRTHQRMVWYSIAHVYMEINSLRHWKPRDLHPKTLNLIPMGLFLTIPFHFSPQHTQIRAKSLLSDEFPVISIQAPTTMPPAD